MKRTLLKRAILLSVLAIMLQDISQAQTASIGPISGASTYLYGPYYRFSATATSNYSKYAYLFTSAELNIPAGSVITEVAWYKASGTLSGNNVWNVFMENTANTTLPTSSTWATISATATSVYSSTTHQFLAGSNSWEPTILTSPFVYTGGSLVVLTDHVKMGTASAANPFYYLSSPGKAIGIASSVVLTGSSSLSNGTFGSNRPTIQITYISPLSVKLVAFNAIRKEHGISVTWTIASEENIDNYVIERSKDGLEFTSAGLVKAAGSLHYEFFDMNALNMATGKLFYRLKSTDKSGKNEYSKVIVINLNDGSPVITLLPNPFSDMLDIYTFAADGGKIDISIKDLKGTVVAEQTSILAVGNNSVRVKDLQRLSPGIYHILINMNGMIYTKQVLK